MPRLRKMRRKQKYQYHINRKRLNQKVKKLPDIKCEAVKKAWDEKKSLTENLTSMGLVADPNSHEGLKISSIKQFRKKETKTKKDDVSLMDTQHEGEQSKNHHVVEALEKQAKDAYNAKKATPHTLPNEMYRKLTRFMDKYGEDFEAMANDHMNHYQETPAQLRSQVNRLKGIPQQWVPYLKSRGLVESQQATPTTVSD